VKKLFLGLLVVNAVSVTFFLWKHHLANDWRDIDPSIFSRSPDASYLYVTVLQSESRSFGFALGFWVESLIAMMVAFRFASSQMALAEKLAGLIIAVAPVSIIAESLMH
jgi:hypothetical protein